MNLSWRKSFSSYISDGRIYSIDVETYGDRKVFTPYGLTPAGRMKQLAPPSIRFATAVYICEYDFMHRIEGSKFIYRAGNRL